MILGKITGRITTTNFRFAVEGDAQKFDYVQVFHKKYDLVLGQIVELVTNRDQTLAICNVIGYLDKDKKTRQLRTPLAPKTEVMKAEDKFIRSVLDLEANKNGAYIGMLDGKNIKIRLDLRKLLTKHITILAKTGAGKSYMASVLIEEILEKKVPLLIIDPHGEYSTLKQKNDNKADIKRMKKFGIEPKGYTRQVHEYGDMEINPGASPIRLNEEMTGREIMHLMPGKLTNNQMSVLYAALKSLKPPTITSLLLELETEENNAKWNLINVIDYLDKLNLFSSDFTPYNELIQPGKCSVLNLKGMEPEVQEIIVYKIMKDLFEERKKGRIPPFFAVIEEAHNFCPERGFGDSKASSIIRTIASEGRKFGLGLCIISQRPARVEKSVISQCNTQVILKVTNPNDLKAIMSSVEGVISETEDSLKNIPVGTGMITGVVDTPLFVNIRPKRSKHGGEAIDILGEMDEDLDMIKETKKFAKKDLLPVIKPKTTIKDLTLMAEQPINKITTYLIPGCLLSIKEKGGQYNLLFDLVKGEIITDVTQSKMIPLSKAKVDLKEHETFEKITYLSVGYDKKIPAKIDVNKLKKELKSEADVVDAKECFIIYHKVYYK